MLGHEISFANHRNGTEVVVTCSCGVVLRAISKTDAMRVARTHIKTESVKSGDKRES